MILDIGLGLLLGYIVNLISAEVKIFTIFEALFFVSAIRFIICKFRGKDYSAHLGTEICGRLMTEIIILALGTSLVFCQFSLSVTGLSLAFLEIMGIIIWLSNHRELSNINEEVRDE